jgi:hypothetical protein
MSGSTPIDAIPLIGSSSSPPRSPSPPELRLFNTKVYIRVNNDLYGGIPHSIYGFIDATFSHLKAEANRLANEYTSEFGANLRQRPTIKIIAYIGTKGPQDFAVRTSLNWEALQAPIITQLEHLEASKIANKTAQFDFIVEYMDDSVAPGPSIPIGMETPKSSQKKPTTVKKPRVCTVCLTGSVQRAKDLLR